MACFFVPEIVLAVCRRPPIRSIRYSHTLDCNLCEGESEYD